MSSIASLAAISLLLLLVLAIAPFFGRYLGRVYLNRPAFGDSILNPIETFFYTLLGTSPRRSMRTREYILAFLLLNGLVIAWIYFVLVYQNHLPGNPLGVPPMSWSLAFHSASSFATNTDFTHFTNETQLSPGAAVFGLQIALFMSAASGLAVTAAFIRGFVRKDGTIGNFYVDIVRTVTRVLLPLSFVGALILVLLGVPQTIGGSIAFLVPSPTVLPLGPVASWTSIELLGTNGGGWFSANAGTPLSNPTELSNLFETALMMLIPFSFPFAFAGLVRRQGEAWPYVGTVLFVFLLALGIFLYAQPNSYPLYGGVPPSPAFSVPGASVFQVVSVYGNVGANNMAIFNLSPLAQADLLFGMFTQGTPGGEGTGFGYLLVYAMVAVFLGGLMVGRTPEYLGKKIGGPSIKWAAAILLSHPFAILIPLAVTVFVPNLVHLPLAPPVGPTAHTFTAVLYEFTSEAANNGSAMSGTATLSSFNDGTTFFNVAGAVVMLFGRFFPMVAMLVIGGLLARQDILPPGPGTLRTNSVTFTVFLIGIVIIIAGLLFLPVLALGPLSQI